MMKWEEDLVKRFQTDFQRAPAEAIIGEWDEGVDGRAEEEAVMKERTVEVWSRKSAGNFIVPDDTEEKGGQTTKSWSCWGRGGLCTWETCTWSMRSCINVHHQLCWRPRNASHAARTVCVAASLYLYNLPDTIFLATAISTPCVATQCKGLVNNKARTWCKDRKGTASFFQQISFLILAR